MDTRLECYRANRHGAFSYVRPARSYLGEVDRRAVGRQVVGAYLREQSDAPALQLAGVLVVGGLLTGFWLLPILALLPLTHQAVVAFATVSRVWPTFAFLADLVGPGLAALALDLKRRGEARVEVKLEHALQFTASMLLSRPVRCVPAHQFGCPHFPITLDRAGARRWRWHPGLRRFAHALDVALSCSNPWAPSLADPTLARR